MAVCLDIDEIQARGDNVVEVLVRQLRLHISGIVENFLDEPFDTIHIVEHHFAEFLNELRIVFSLRGQLDKRLDRREGVSNFMGEAARHCFQRF
jgi:hypothetical protein